MSQSLGFFFIVSAFLGLDFGYTSILSRIPKYVAKFIILSISLFNVALLIKGSANNHFSSDNVNFNKSFKFMQILWFPTLCIQLIAYSLILQTSKYGFYKFQMDINKIDGTMYMETKYVGIAVTLSIFGGFLVKSACMGLTQLDFLHITLLDGVINILHFIPTTALDIVASEVFLVYYYVHKFSKCLKVSFYNSESNLKSVQSNYVSLANCLDKIKPEVHKLLTIQLIFDVPELLFLLWGCVLLTKIKTPWLLIFGELCNAVHIIVQLVLPALMVEMANSQINALKRLLHEELLKEQVSLCPECEAKEEPEADGLLRYLEARPLDDKLWSVLPNDLRLLVTLFSLCSTYFVVLVQLTHLDE